MKNIIVLLSLLIWTMSGNLSAAEEEPVKIKNIILIGWDGVGRLQLERLLRENEVPNIRILSAAGRLSAVDNIRFTETKPGFAQLLTGYESDITGVYSNDKYRSIPYGFTIYERLEDFFGAGNILTGAIIGKNRNLGMEPGEPYYYARQKMDFYRYGVGSHDEVGEETLKTLDKIYTRPFFLFLHFPEPDLTAHARGEDSPQYRQAVMSADAWLGLIMEKLRKLRVEDRTYIYVTSDHGFNIGEKKHYDAPHVFLATNDKGIMRKGYQTDVAATILSRFGMDLKKIIPPLQGKPLTEADNELW